MRTKNNLTGKWHFVGAEKHDGKQWQPSQNYTEGMSWEFFPEYFSERKNVGTIHESSPLNSPIDLSYTYDSELSTLTIETSNDPAEADKYEIIPLDEQQIMISIVNEQQQPELYFRYILSSVKSE